MRIAVLGTGDVGRALASAFAKLGHEVTIGSRSADNAAGSQWAAENQARCATFAEAAAGAEVIVNATAGSASLAALELAGSEAIDNKVLIDVANPLDFSNGFPPTLTVCNDSSLGEQIQSAFPAALVVKTLNTVNNQLMVNPGQLGHNHVIFVAGNDDGAKQTVRSLLAELGWDANQIVDLGDITGARAAEMYLPLWVRLFQTRGNADFNISIVSN